MTKDEILQIKEHIEIHAKREPRAIKITEIMWKAVSELERIAKLEQHISEMEKGTYSCCAEVEKDNRLAELEKENAELKSIADFQQSSDMDRYFQLKKSKEQLTKAKEMCEDMKADMCGTDNEVLYDYLARILKKYGEIV